MLDTPILLLIFNRPETTRRVFETIRAAKPRQLFVAADGPRAGRPDDVDRALEARRIATAVDWDCEVKTFFRENNLGCGRAPSEGISWFFEHVEEGIVLEDDCLPVSFFYEFCSVLLKHYRNHERVAHISGNNFQNGVKRGEGSYYFSAYSHNWGWASWRSRWHKFNYSMQEFDPQKLRVNLKHYGFTREEMDFWIQAFDNLKHTPSDIWDYQWEYAIWMNKGLSILPNQNLIQNIGFGADATHTKVAPDKSPELEAMVEHKIVHPHKIFPDVKADHYTFRKYYSPKESLLLSMMNRLKRVIKST